MELKTFDTILTQLCDNFDQLIAPRVISRSNTNVIFLLLKAIAKGYEVINNTVLSLSNKFDPRSCDDEDLDSSAMIVGTERYKGSASGLRITVRNSTDDTLILPAGTYTYALDSETSFEFEVIQPVTLQPGGSVTYIAMSNEIGSFPVTEQTDITVSSSVEIPGDIKFSCGNNSALLGTEDETDLEFRQRIIQKTDRQNTLVELEDEVRNLPYVFDCCVKYNNELVSVQYDGETIPPFSALICVSGEIKRELAEKVCSKILCPTVQTAESVAVPYESDVFVGGEHTVYITPFKKTIFNVEIIYMADSTLVNDYDMRGTVRTAMENHFRGEVHKDYVKEDDIYNFLASLNLTGVDVLGVNLYAEGNQVDYVSIPKTRLPELGNITFSRRQ
jgi:hypothetical protein